MANPQPLAKPIYERVAAHTSTMGYSAACWTLSCCLDELSCCGTYIAQVITMHTGSAIQTTHVDQGGQLGGVNLNTVDSSVHISEELVHVSSNTCGKSSKHITMPVCIAPAFAVPPATKSLSPTTESTMSMRSESCGGTTAFSTMQSVARIKVGISMASVSVVLMSSTVGTRVLLAISTMRWCPGEIILRMVSTVELGASARRFMQLVKATLPFCCPIPMKMLEAAEVSGGGNHGAGNNVQNQDTRKYHEQADRKRLGGWVGELVFTDNAGVHVPVESTATAAAFLILLQHIGGAPPSTAAAHTTQTHQSKAWH